MAVTPKSFFTPRVLVLLLAIMAVPAALIFSNISNEVGQLNSYESQSAIGVEAVPATTEEAAPEFQQGFLGIGIQTVDARRVDPRCNRQIVPGVLVVRVIENMSAFNAGLAPNDIVTHVDGNRVTEASELKFLVSTTPAGHKVKLTVLRDGGMLNLYPTLDAKPQAIVDAERTVAMDRNLIVHDHDGIGPHVHVKGTPHHHHQH